MSKPTVVFMGDSLTEWMPEPKLNNYNLVMAGYSGMGVGYLNHIAQQIMQHHQPYKVWLCIGINDVWMFDQGQRLEDWEEQFASLCEQITGSGAILYGSTLMPAEKAGFGTEINLHWIYETNQAIARQVADCRGILVDSFAHFAQADGYLPSGYSEDGIHLTLATYEKWVPFICDSMGID